MDFDVVFGIDATSFSAGVDELNKKKHDAFFKGVYGNSDVSGTWEVVDRSPVFGFQAPTAAKWHDSVDGAGGHPTGDPPTDNVFVLVVPELHLVFTDDGAPADLTPGIEFYGQFALADGTASLTPLAIWADPSTLSDSDKWVMEHLILPNVFKKLGDVLKAHEIAPQKITVGGNEIELTTTHALITGTHLVVVATADTGTAQGVPTAWPTQPVFAIINRDFAQHLAQATAGASQNKTVYDSTKSNSKAAFQAKAVVHSVKDIKVDPSDATSWSAALDVAFDASASLLGQKCALKKSSDSL